MWCLIVSISELYPLSYFHTARKILSRSIECTGPEIGVTVHSQGLSIQRVNNLYHMFKNCCRPVCIDYTFNNCWFLVYKWSVMEKQVTISYKWLPVFTLLTNCRLGISNYSRYAIYSHKSRTQSVNYQCQSLLKDTFRLLYLLYHHMLNHTV